MDKKEKLKAEQGIGFTGAGRKVKKKKLCDLPPGRRPSPWLPARSAYSSERPEAESSVRDKKI